MANIFPTKVIKRWLVMTTQYPVGVLNELIPYCKPWYCKIIKSSEDFLLPLYTDFLKD